MKEPSQKSHLYRLGIILAAGFAVFMVVLPMAEPESWNYEGWYRAATLEDMKKLPLAYGGNESCAGCHASETEDIKPTKHVQLSCESCHGALADHVKGTEKIADAHIDEEGRWQCLNCHKTLVTKSKAFPQFSPTRTPEHEVVDAETACTACHDAHDPAL